jgi:excinuclease ABC subunit A
VSWLSIKKAYDWVQALPDPDRKADGDRSPHPEGDLGPAALPEQRRPRLPQPVAASGTLSGGESQRIRLASQIGSGLTGVLYVLDEPSIGLHQRDNTRLLESLMGLRDLGNSVLVVEHDEEAILTADYVIDMGPAAGIHGGRGLRRGHARRGHGQSELADRQIPDRRARDRTAARGPPSRQPQEDAEDQRARPATT